MEACGAEGAKHPDLATVGKAAEVLMDVTTALMILLTPAALDQVMEED